MAKRKPSSKPRKTARRRKPSGFTQRLKIYLLGGSVAILVLAVLMGLSGWIGYEMGKEKAVRQCERTVGDYRKDIERLRHRLQQAKVAAARPKPSRPKKPSVAKKPPSEVRDYLQSGGDKATRPPVREPVKSKRPMLVLIIDDVAFPSQAKAIKKLPWHVTPSIFPPTRRHPETPKIAKRFDHYMIHLPMEAMRFNSPEDATLTVQSGNAQIDLRMRQIRHWFPDARFVNNHTGSRFTSDMGAMLRFYPVAKRYGFRFVDSRTTPETVVPEVCKRFGDPYIARDVFLDNKPDIAYIQNQLKKAVKIARSHGYAIAIGHPHPSTLEALAKSGPILKGVDVVYIDELYEKIR